MVLVTMEEECASEREERRNASTRGSVSRRRYLKTAALSGGVMAGLAGCTGGDGGTEGDGGSDGSTGTVTGGTNGGSNSQLADTINVYTFGGENAKGIKQGYINGFSEEYGVEVNHQTISSGWDLIPKIKNGSVDAHVVEQNPGSVLGGVSDVWQQIRLDNVPTVLENLEEDRLRGDSEETTFDPGDEWHHVPKEVWAQGLVYNHDAVEEPTSWQDIYTEELKDKLTNTSFVALALGVAASEVGVNFNEIANDDSVAEQIWNRVGEQNEYVYKWWESGSSAQQLLTRESALAGNFWYGRAVSLRESQNVPISYTVPEEGTVMGVSCWTVGVEEDPGRRTAEKFIDYTARPEPSGEYATHIPYYQPYSVSDPPKAYEENPDNEHIDRLKLWDYELVAQNREKWSQKFQKTLRG